MQKLNLVIVGHVDHGKSTLIGRLLFDTNSLSPDKIEELEASSRNLGREIEFAFLLDHLKEERDQGITIDTTQICFKTPYKEYVIIDAPGHLEFVKNMITGAAQAQAAILIIDVAQGIKEQSRRHVNILTLLGIEQLIVVLNKMDLVEYKEEVFRKIKGEIEKFLDLAGIHSSHFIPISASLGDNIVRRSDNNMSWYQGPTLLEGLDSFSMEMPQDEKFLIFPIQDVYKIAEKRINVGRIESGRIKPGEIIKILPERKITRVKSLEKFEGELTEATAGESIGVVTEDPLFIERGNIICREDNEPLLVQEFEAKIFWLDKEPCREGEILSLRCATQEVLAEVKEIKKRIDSEHLKIIEESSFIIKNLEVGDVVIKTKKPIAITKFNDLEELGRFVLMRKDNVSAGGIII